MEVCIKLFIAYRLCCYSLKSIYKYNSYILYIVYTVVAIFIAYYYIIKFKINYFNYKLLVVYIEYVSSFLYSFKHCTFFVLNKSKR